MTGYAILLAIAIVAILDLGAFVRRKLNGG